MKAIVVLLRSAVNLAIKLTIPPGEFSGFAARPSRLRAWNRVGLSDIAEISLWRQSPDDQGWLIAALENSAYRKKVFASTVNEEVTLAIREIGETVGRL